MVDQSTYGRSEYIWYITVHMVDQSTYGRSDYIW